MKEHATIACTECGLIQTYRVIPVGMVAVCSRCTKVLYRNNPHMFSFSLALTVNSLVLFIISNAFPMLELRAQGMLQEFTLWEASLVFWDQDYLLLAVLMSLNLLLFPLFELCSLLWILLTIRLNWRPEPALWLYRWMQQVKPWGMLEVFMLGMLVAVVKLGDLATLILGYSFWSFIFLIISMASATAVLDAFSVWQRLKTCHAP
ncbi:MAG: paraquat-inducible membrane protein A [Proteobacteria bacterium]|nr:MAG: paraquat-inducible membrane protein A [Pseudomonadota bacterium]